MADTSFDERRNCRRGNRLKEISHALSRTLRHVGRSQGFNISDDGYVAIEELLNYEPYKRKYNLIREDVLAVVELNDKKRFELSANGTRVRACQGHSFDVDVGLKRLAEDELPRHIIHGTTVEAWNKIKIKGLSKMSRLHIHMAAGLHDMVTSGIRKSSNVYIYIDGRSALRDGVEFFESSNGVILSSGIDGVIPPKYFLQVTDAAGNAL